MIDNDLRASQERLSALEEQLNIGLKDEGDKLENKIADNLRAQLELVDRLNRVQLTLDNLLETRALYEPSKPIDQVGKSKAFIKSTFLARGVLPAIFVVFIAEFAAKVREQV